MRVPIRRAQLLKKQDELTIVHVTRDGLEKLKKELASLEKQHPQAVEEVIETGSRGDFSENAEYQEAKRRLRAMNDRIGLLKEKIKKAKVIEKKNTKNGTVELGSTVIVEVGGRQKTYEIVGPEEAHPSHGRISYLSPLGAALIGQCTGQTVALETEHKRSAYKIITVK